MWIITHATTGESVCFLEQKLKYTVGRLGTDVELQDDICVSRAHAAFHLVKDKVQYKLELEDLGSKYGTFVNKDIENNAPLEKGRKIVLNNNDLIRFGRLENVWRVQSIVILTVTSSLSNEDNLQLNTYISALGGKILDQWSPRCTHLTMNDPSITMKLLHAVIDQKLVVTTAYWRDLLNAVNSKRAILPRPELYNPDFGDKEIDFGTNAKRSSLFKGYTFVFLNRKHFDMYSPIITSAGGACKDLNSGVQKAFLIKDNVVVIQYTPSTQTQSSQTINTIAEFLEANSKRIIPEYEIGLAILHCSIEKYCNPCFKMTQAFMTVPATELTDDSMRIDLTDEQSTPNTNSATMDLNIPETIPFNPPNVNSNREDESMPNIHITETPVENQRKRKMNKFINANLEESDDEATFQLKSKKSCDQNDNVEKSAENVANQSSNNNENLAGEENPSTSKSNTTKTGKFANFLEKTQTKNKTQNSVRETEEMSARKEIRKRPLVQVLDENDEGNDDDDDLFRFGDTQKTKKSRPDQEQQNNDDGDDLFKFKEKDPSNNAKRMRTIDVDDEDSCDVALTQPFIVPEKVHKKPSIQMPKPKILPRKISAIEWISSSFGKIKIKKENSTLNNDENIIKTELDVKPELNDELTISEEHRKWLDSLKDAIEIQQVSLNNAIKCGDAGKSHYKFKNLSNNTSENLNKTFPNFKKFVKKCSVTPQQNSTAIKLNMI